MAFTSEQLLLLTALLVAVSTQDIRLPPSITFGPPKNVLYRDKVQVNLTCEAVGYPAPTFAWLKNGAALSESGVVRPDPNAGSIEIGEPTKDHEGDYQCWATNLYGQTMSNVTVLRVATLGTFDGNDPKINYNVKANDKLRVKCNNPPESTPSPRYVWSYNTTSLAQTDVILSKRVQIDFNGDMCIASVASDEPTNRLYRCNVHNDVMSTAQSGAYSRIQVSGSISGAAPALFFSSPARVVALRSQQTILRCFFSGSDNNGQGTITYSWTYNGGNFLPDGWVNSDVEAKSPESGTASSDAGLYMCFGRNTLGQNSTTIELVVEAIPDFGGPENQPHDMNVTEGETITIKCLADAIPEATIQWFKNGTAFDQNSLPPKFALSADLTELTISNVCKNCSDGTSDLMAIQCNASNVHGYSFAQGYVNVLLAATITSAPVTVNWAPNENYKFDCAATCDDSTPCTREWTYEGTTVPVDDTRLFVDDGGSLNIVTANDTDGGSSRIGTYQCIVTNSYSESRIDATIVGGGMVSSAELWWVGLLVALLVLLLLLFVLLFLFCCYCRDGKSYPVDKNERKNGNDPVKELRDKGFHTYVQTKSPITSVAFENFVTGSPVTNTFYVEDPVNDYFFTSVPPPTQPQPSPAAAVPAGNYYITGTDISKNRLSHSSQGEVVTVTVPNLWRPHDEHQCSEV